MKTLRTIRIVLSLLFFLCAVAYLVLSAAHGYVFRFAEEVQILPSILSVSMGVILVWIVLTVVFGRIYCSSVCPVGTFQDIVIAICRRLRIGRMRRPFRYQPAGRIRYHILIIYAICLIVGVTAVPYWIEPWNIMRNICSVVNPQVVESTWLELGIGMLAGIVSGIVSFLLIVICSVFTGRGYCTDICPIGTVLGALNSYTFYHMEIDPDRCTGCLKCEEACKSQCIKVVGRYVDNSRCVRCFDCVAVCPEDAIRFQANRNRPATPLMQKKKAFGK